MPKKKTEAADAAEEVSEEKKDQAAEAKKEDKEAERKKALEGQEVQDGDFVKIDIMGKTIEDDPAQNIVFEASNPEDAKLLLNYDPKKAYQYVPELAIVGKKGFVLDKIDENLKGMKFFEEKILDLEPKDAYGERKGENIEKMNAKLFKKDMGEDPKPGATYRDKKKNRQGTVIRVAQGRCIIDYNHPLAGKKIQYKVKIVDKIEGIENQVNGFIERRFPGMPPQLFNFKHEVAEKVAEVEIPQFLELQVQGQNLFYMKYGLSMDLQEYIPDVETVRFTQVFKKFAKDEHEHDHEHEGHVHETEAQIVEKPELEDSEKTEE
jgi:FKBP-type peptidyl-prolyl cis-trans isomerase 2